MKSLKVDSIFQRSWVWCMGVHHIPPPPSSYSSPGVSICQSHHSWKGFLRQYQCNGIPPAWISQQRVIKTGCPSTRENLIKKKIFSTIQILFWDFLFVCWLVFCLVLCFVLFCSVLRATPVHCSVLQRVNISILPKHIPTGLRFTSLRLRLSADSSTCSYKLYLSLITCPASVPLGPLHFIQDTASIKVSIPLDNCLSP